MDFLALIAFIFWIVSKIAKANRASQAKQQSDVRQTDNRFGQPGQRQVSVFDQAAESTNQVPPKKSAMVTLADIGGKLSNFESLLESLEGNFESSEGKQIDSQATQGFEPKNLPGSMDYVSNEGTGPAYGTNSEYSTTNGQSYVSGSMDYVSQEGNTSMTSVPLGVGLGSLKAYDPDANYENLNNDEHLLIGSFKLNRQSLQQAFVLAEVLGKRGGKYAWTKR